MKVLVIGGAGYIGRPLVRLLRERVDTLSVGHRNGPDVDEQVDLRHAGDVYQVLARARPTVVVVTAYLLARASNADPHRAVETNVLGLTNVFQAASDLGVRRIVFASSGAVHGGTDDVQCDPMDETMECRPTTLYGRMKLFNEWIAEHYNANFGSEIVSYRVSGPYGWGRSFGRQGGEIPFDTVVAAAAREPREQGIVLPWSASSRFRFIHVADAAASFLPLILSDTLRHRVYNSPGFTTSVGELADAATSICGLECTFTDPGRPVKLVSWDTTRYDSEFKFRPRPMVEWLREEVGSGAIASTAADATPTTTAAGAPR
jgi:nucleoside-diphosphate-sugar epimerase